MKKNKFLKIILLTIPIIMLIFILICCAFMATIIISALVYYQVDCKNVMWKSDEANIEFVVRDDNYYNDGYFTGYKGIIEIDNEKYDAYFYIDKDFYIFYINENNETLFLRAKCNQYLQKVVVVIEVDNIYNNQYSRFTLRRYAI